MLNKKALVCALLYREHKKKQKTRRYSVNPMNSQRLIKGKFHLMHLKLLNDPEKFYDYYGMSPAAFTELLSLIGPYIQRQDTIFKFAISPEERLSVALRYLKTGMSLSAVSSEYLLGMTTVMEIIKAFCNQVCRVLQPLFMKKKSEEEWIIIADQFYEKTSFPNVIGVVNGKRIQVRKVGKNFQPNHQNGGATFRSKSGFCSCVLVTWSDANCNFINVDVIEEEHYNDSDIFEISDMGRRVTERTLDIPCGRKLPNDDKGKVMPFCVLVGDEAFRQSDFVLRPYVEKNLTPAKRIYNCRHAKACGIDECALRILSSKWNILNRALDFRVDSSVVLIKACCILHNYIHDKDGINITETFYECGLDRYMPNLETQGKSDLIVREYLKTYFGLQEGLV